MAARSIREGVASSVARMSAAKCGTAAPGFRAARSSGLPAARAAHISAARDLAYIAREFTEPWEDAMAVSTAEKKTARRPGPKDNVEAIRQAYYDRISA